MCYPGIDQYPTSPPPILKKAVAAQLYDFIQDIGLFDDFHLGFRKHESTGTALMKVTIVTVSDKWLIFILALLDLRAFDTIDHHILLLNFDHKIDMKLFALRWFKSYLFDGYNFIYVNDIIQMG